MTHFRCSERLIYCFQRRELYFIDKLGFMNKYSIEHLFKHNVLFYIIHVYILICVILFGFSGRLKIRALFHLSVFTMTNFAYLNLHACRQNAIQSSHCESKSNILLFILLIYNIKLVQNICFHFLRQFVTTPKTGARKKYCSRSPVLLFRFTCRSGVTSNGVVSDVQKR